MDALKLWQITARTPSSCALRGPVARQSVAVFGPGEHHQRHFSAWYFIAAS